MKVYLVCTGVGNHLGGIESFARECFDGLRGTMGLDIKLLKGAGEWKADEYPVWNIGRNTALGRLGGHVMGRNGYVFEQLSSFLAVARAIREGRPDLIFTSDSNLMFQLFRWRRQIRVPYRILFSNGGPCGPPFIRCEHVQQVAPVYLAQAIAAGEPPEKHSLVPYGIEVPAGSRIFDRKERERLRVRLNLPERRAIVISVGWISATHKRMDYIVREVAMMPPPRPFLLILGREDRGSPQIHALAAELLGQGNYCFKAVPYEDIGDYYRCADLFVLASLSEGFGRVLLEALIHGLPCIAHSHEVMRFVLGNEGIFGDLRNSGALSELMATALEVEPAPDVMRRRRELVRERFSWPRLAPAYMAMFARASAAEIA